MNLIFNTLSIMAILFIAKLRLKSEFANVFRTMPDSEEAGEYRDWLGLGKDEIWSTDTFNLDEINANLKEV